MAEVKEYLTKEKHQELEKELEHLKKTKRREIADQLEYAKSMGDLSENAEYQEARELQAEVEERVNKLEQILKHAVLLKDHHGSVVQVGSIVVVEKKTNKTKKTYQIVGSEEADISSGKISNESPLGLALLYKKKGDEFSINTPGGKVSYIITDIK